MASLRARRSPSGAGIAKSPSVAPSPSSAAIVVAAIGYYGPKLVKKGMSAVGDAIAESAQAEASWFPEEVGATVERMKDEG